MVYVPADAQELVVQGTLAKLGHITFMNALINRSMQERAMTRVAGALPLSIEIWDDTRNQDWDKYSDVHDNTHAVGTAFSFSTPDTHALQSDVMNINQFFDASTEGNWSDIDYIPVNWQEEVTMALARKLGLRYDFYHLIELFKGVKAANRNDLGSTTLTDDDARDETKLLATGKDIFYAVQEFALTASDDGYGFDGVMQFSRWALMHPLHLHALKTYALDKGWADNFNMTLVRGELNFDGSSAPGILRGQLGGTALYAHNSLNSTDSNVQGTSGGKQTRPIIMGTNRGYLGVTQPGLTQAFTPQDYTGDTPRYLFRQVIKTGSKMYDDRYYHIWDIKDEN